MNYYGYRDIIAETMTTLEEAEDERYEKHERLIPFEFAIRRALRWQKDHPTWYVCGSVALMAAGHIYKGDVSDIDFVTNEFPGSYYQPYKGKYVHPKPGDKPFPPYYHYEPAGAGGQICLFVFHGPHDRIVYESNYYHGLKLQSIADVLKWKRLFNRQKDKADLNLMSSLNVLPDELFEI
jgi:hypothetical protein